VDPVFEYRGVVFVWDADKADENRRKHGVRFEEAVEAFFDPFFRVSDAGDSGEQRHAVLGMDMAGSLLFVVHVEREDDAIRLISARRATRHERRFYEDY
jgi:uncharacterized DUF497 family protein